MSDSHWETIENKQVAPVPVYFDDATVQITSIASEDISKTYTFDGPNSIPSLSRSMSPKTRRLSLLKPPGSPGSRFSFRLSRSPSPSSSNHEDFDEEDSTDSHSRDSRDFSPSHAKEALVYARNQLLSSNDLRKMGGNVLFFEGWTVTKLRRGSRYRLVVTYRGRPAFAVHTHPGSSALPSSPPFMDILGDGY
ncbi:hypothetical protein FRC02_008026 [Tulasnella sp. 418]|nr:hypothetical protein FRC02_008026 [Tulasnella sp. 418]